MEYGFTDILQLLGSLGVFLFGINDMIDKLIEVTDLLYGKKDSLLNN